MKIEDIVEFAPATQLNRSNELVDVVMKFKDGTTVTEVKADRTPGSRTEVQVFLSSLPRTTDALTCPKIKVLGKTWTLGHAYQTDQERNKTSVRGSGSGSSSSSDGSVKLSKEKWELLVSIGEKSKDKDLLAFIEENKPVDSKVQKAKDLVDNMSEAQKEAFLIALGLKK